MRRIRIVLVVAALLVVACGGGEVAVEAPTAAITAVPLTPSATVSPSATPTIEPSPTTPSTPPAPTPSPSPTQPTPTPSPPPPAPTILTADDSGGTFRVGVGEVLLVRLGEEGMRWSDLSQSGDAVAVHERLFLVDPGYREWEVTGVKPGESVLTSTGGLPCHDETPPCLAPNRLFEVTIVVEQRT
ncbi:MAG: hypothetical protein R3249_09315 [Nitriliruptorales bacterium]|nr:hypothetical protein [Nitriliruptorales bacterium]